MATDHQYIKVSGLPTYEELKRDTQFPSGIFGINVEAYLSSFTANFGFNTSPHKFEFQYIPSDFSFTTLPAIGSGISFSIGDFYIAGRVKHADYSKSTGGKVLSIQIEDIREDLEDFYIDTYGLFGSNDAPTTGVVDVRYWYVKNYVETRLYGRSRIIRDLDLLENQGASYRQIYEAVKYFEESIGNVTSLVSKIPLPEVIEAQLPLEPDAYRWKFRGQPLIQVLNKIFGDVSYEWYWNMKEQKINVINRKYAVDINEDAIPIANDINETRNSKYGYDYGERPTNVRFLGAEMEGLIGKGTLKTESGAYELSASDYDMGIEVGDLLFTPGWKATLKYYGADGWLNSYVPSDRELAMALKGMEFWCAEKKLDNRITNQTMDSLIGTIFLQPSFSASGIGRIENRRQADRAWIIEWYNRVRSHAQNHFGRTYVLNQSSTLYNYLDEIEVINAAWCNIENLTDDGAFNDNYKIKPWYRFLSIFWEHKANKMRGWASFPGNTKWGFDGEGTPGNDYNEDENIYYVPIEVKKWDISQKKFSEEFLEELSSQEQGIMIRLPNLAWDYSRSTPDSVLSTMHRLKTFNFLFGKKTTIDVPDPFRIPLPFLSISDVTLPIKVKRRYGYSYPEVWASGTGDSREVIIKDDFAPWNYEPRGTKTSVEMMNDEVKAGLSGRVVNRNSVTFAEAAKLNLPVISFDSFANQNQTIQGFGIISHGVTSLNVTKSLEWFQTKYSVKSHYPELIKAKPISKVIGEDFDFLLRRLKEDEARVPKIPAFRVPTFFSPKTDDGRESIKADSGIEQKLERHVTIQQVFDRGENEHYLSIDSNNIQWPRALANGFGSYDTQKVHCIDGFLQVGMTAVYHLEIQPDGSEVQYYTGGVPLETGRIVELITAPALVDEIYYASVRTLPTIVTAPDGTEQTVSPFYLYNLPFLAQQAVDTSLQSGDKLMMAGHGNKKTLVPDGDYSATGSRNGDAWLVNTGVPSSVSFGYVTTGPIADGTGGAVKTYSAAGGTAYADDALVGIQRYHIRFVGCETDQIATNDPCVISQERESGGDIRLYCFIVKPTFTSGGAYF